MANRLEEARKIINDVDSQMADLFVKRMKAAEIVFEYKKEFGLPVFDAKREEEVIARNSALIEDEVLKEYYHSFIKNMMALSREYQYHLENESKEPENESNI